MVALVVLVVGVEKISLLMEMQAKAHTVAQAVKAETTSVAVLAEAVEVTNTAVAEAVAEVQATLANLAVAVEQVSLEELLFLKRRYHNGKIRRN
jgi:hypothetical protein